MVDIDIKKSRYKSIYQELHPVTKMVSFKGHALFLWLKMSNWAVIEIVRHIIKNAPKENREFPGGKTLDKINIWQV